MKLKSNIYNTLTALLFVSTRLFIVSFIKILNREKRIFIEWELFNINRVSFVIRLIFDWKSLAFLSTVSLISTFIIIYRKYYIEGDKNYVRFSLILVSFILSIILLIIRPNLVRLILGWDGLGLTSYALVIFYQNEYSANSGIITILRNRVGDSTLLLRIGWLLYQGSYNFIFMNSINNTIILLIILRAFTKRAQIPFSAWLPAAMAAPTPVSALVHSSTLVTAGVFLIIRFIPLLKTSNLLIFPFIIGILTIFIAGWRANFESDLKKVIALSTLSQLGLIFIILGLGNEVLGFFHLVIHALFKSSLFICAGFIIHNTHNRQDRRFVGSFNFSSPVLGLVFGCTNISLCGFPFITGFFSKDIILESSFNNFTNNLIYTIILIRTGLTLAYRIRAIYITSREQSKTLPVTLSTDFANTMVLATSLLFFLRATRGYFLSSLIVRKGFIFSLTERKKFSILIILGLTLLLSRSIFNRYFSILTTTKKWFSSLMIFLPMITKLPFTFVVLKAGVLTLKLNDKGWFERSGPQGVTSVFKTIRVKINKTNILELITLYILASILILRLILVLS